MLHRILPVVVAVVLLFALATVSLGAGVLGETDLMYIPTTTTLNPNNLGIAINFSEGQLSYFNFDYGLIKDLEVGLAVFNYPTDTRVTIRGKYQLLHENNGYPGLAIGLQDLGENDISPYLVLSKTFSDAGINGYLGAGGGSYDGIFAGLSKTFYLEGASKNGNQLNWVNLYLEADSHNLSVGTKLGVGSMTKINFGLVDMKDWMLGVTFLLK